MSDAGNATPLDERALRRPDFLGGPEVVLADGQSFCLPRPLSYFAMDDDSAGVRRHWNLGDEYGVLFDRAMDADTDLALVTGELALATFLLRRNYDLTAAQAGSLLRFGYGANADPAAAAIRAAVMAVVTGQEPPPKASSDGPG